MVHNPRGLHFFNSLDIAIILPSLAAFLLLLPHFNERSAPHPLTPVGLFCPSWLMRGRVWNAAVVPIARVVGSGFSCVWHSSSDIYATLPFSPCRMLPVHVDNIDPSLHKSTWLQHKESHSILLWLASPCGPRSSSSGLLHVQPLDCHLSGAISSCIQARHG